MFGDNLSSRATDGRTIDWDNISALVFKFVSEFENREKPLFITKLLKLIFYFDFITVKQDSKPFTGDFYCKLPYGPVPMMIKFQLDLLKEDKDDGYGTKSVFEKYLELEYDSKTGGSKVKVKKGIENKEKELKNFDDHLSPADENLLSELVNAFEDISVKDIVNLTHKEIPYTKTTEREIIPYALAFEKKFPRALHGYTNY